MDDNYQESLKTLLQHTVRGKILRKRDLLRLFAFYISSNPDFKYNITYLTDSILPFFSLQKELIDRYVTFEAVTEKIAKLTPEKVRATLVFDNFFRFSIVEKTILDCEFVNTDQYRFDKIDTKNYVIKFIIEDEKEQNRTETYRFSSDLIKKALKNDKLQSEIEKNWRRFIK